MGHLYLAGWRQDPQRAGGQHPQLIVDLGPNTEDWMTGGHSVIDLSPTSALGKTDGLAVVSTTQPITQRHANVVELGDDPRAVLSHKTLERLRDRFGTTRVGDARTVGGALRSLFAHGDRSKQDVWNPVEPSHRTGKSCIVLDGDVLEEWQARPPRRASIAVTDDFTYANGALESVSANWVVVYVNPSAFVVSNELHCAGGETTFYRHTAAADTDDQYAEWDIWTAAPIPAHFGAMFSALGVRSNLEGFASYDVQRHFNPQQRRIMRGSSLAFPTVLDSTPELAADTTPVRYRIEVEGSTLRSYADGGGERSTTDSAYSGPSYRSTTIAFFVFDGRADNWAFGDYTPVDIEPSAAVGLGLAVPAPALEAVVTPATHVPTLAAPTPQVDTTLAPSALAPQLAVPQPTVVGPIDPTTVAPVLTIPAPLAASIITAGALIPIEIPAVDVRGVARPTGTALSFAVLPPAVAASLAANGLPLQVVVLDAGLTGEIVLVFLDTATATDTPEARRTWPVLPQVPIPVRVPGYTKARITRGRR